MINSYLGLVRVGNVQLLLFYTMMTILPGLAAICFFDF